MGQTIDVMVDGGKANAGPLGPALGPAGINIGEVVAAINAKTAEFNGMQVPVKIIIDDKKAFTITVGTPPATALIKDKLGIQKGSGNPRKEFVADMDMANAISIAKMKFDDLQGATLKNKTREVAGTCTSMGVTFMGQDARKAKGRFDAGEFDSHFE
jgi:large subunit ribosomal protein L11